MAYGGNDWLALTQEPTLEPELPICDPHHHFWDLNQARVPYTRYLLHELLDDVRSGHNIRSTVFIEAREMYRADGPPEMRCVGEVEFVNGIAAMSASGHYGPTRVAAAIVGNADLGLGSRVEPVLDALQAASPRFRGIRRSVTFDEHAAAVQNAQPENTAHMLADASFREGARVLARKGLTFEAWLYWTQLSELVDFARAVPELTIVMNHIGGLVRIGPYEGRDDEVLPAWRKGVAAVAECPNVHVKLGGLGLPRMGFGWWARTVPVGSEELAETMAPFLHYCIEQFGPERSMFESNYPVDKVSFSYNVCWNAFKRLSTGYSPSDRAAMFHDNAARVYRIGK